MKIYEPNWPFILGPIGILLILIGVFFYWLTGGPLEPGWGALVFSFGFIGFLVGFSLGFLLRESYYERSYNRESSKNFTLREKIKQLEAKAEPPSGEDEP